MVQLSNIFFSLIRAPLCEHTALRIHLYANSHDIPWLFILLSAFAFPAMLSFCVSQGFYIRGSIGTELIKCIYIYLYIIYMLFYKDRKIRVIYILWLRVRIRDTHTHTHIYPIFPSWLYKKKTSSFSSLCLHRKFILGHGRLRSALDGLLFRCRTHYLAFYGRVIPSAFWNLLLHFMCMFIYIYETY